MKILLAVDGSEFSNRMFQYVLAHPEFMSAEHEYTLLTVVPAIPSYPTKFLSKEMVNSYYADEANKVLEPLQAVAMKNNWHMQAEYIVGRAVDVISEEAEYYDLVVMGTHGHTALGNVVMGSVPTGVIARTQTPILLIR